MAMAQPPPHRRFRDRTEAGDVLGQALREYAGRPGVLVLGLARGGVPVAARVAKALGAPLDVAIVRKLGLPWQPELAMGAIASGGVRVLNQEVLYELGVPPAVVDAVAARELAELERREHVYREGRPPADLAGRSVILVDDGLATGSSMESAIAALRRRRPAAMVVAVPVAPVSTCRRIAPMVDRLVCVQPARRFVGVGEWYEDFSPTTDEEVRRLLSPDPVPGPAGHPVPGPAG
jgi:putative phosphoribosyl transferase